ncbi:MAG TPA: GNAT family N-acetyltransferase [Acidobacteriaceae bacterium]|nr:GNAT family N-acetyltransferase [Acidobacteriaceae bacterium]
MTLAASHKVDPIRVRKAQPADLEAILALERATASAPHWPRAAYREMVQQGESPVRRVLLIAGLCDAGDATMPFRLVGFAAAGIQGDSAEWESIAVAARTRRSGVGRALGEAMIAWSREEGATEITLEVRAASAGAIAFYREMGFAEAARRPGYYHDPEDDAVLMRRLSTV